jgi:hypothetical protein
MKRTLLLLTAFVFAFCMAAPVMAADLPKPVDKMVKGTTEVIKAPIVTYDTTKADIKAADLKPFELLKSFVKAPFHLAKNVGSGAMDIATFPIE